MSWIIFLSIIGLALVCLEVFVPGMVLGTLGVLCLIAAVVVTYTLHGMAAGHIALVTLLVSSAVVLILWITFFPKTRSGKSMITSRTLADSKSADTLAKLHGKTGRALTPLRPAGTAIIDDLRVDVVAESGLIDQESFVRVIRVEGNRVFVRKVS